MKTLREELKAERRAHRRLQRNLLTLPRHEFGSLTPGVAGWSERWRDRSGARVLLFASKDYSGSFMKWAHALNAHSEYAARLVLLQAHEYGYENDLVLTPSLVRQEEGLLALAAMADVIHIKDETGFFLGTNGIPQDTFAQLGKPMVFTHYGGYARKHCDDSAYQEFVRGFDARIAMTPDLNYDWFEGSFIPHSVDTNLFLYGWHDGRRLAHSPSTAARKGTSTLLEALRGLDVDFDLIEGVPHEVCLARKAQSNLFFDQAGREQLEKLGTDRVIGWYGNSALEAAVLGIPTMAHLSEEAFQGAARAGKDIRERCGILGVPLDAAGIRERIEWFFGISSEERRELSLETRRWVEEFHSYEANARELADVYDRVVDRPADPEEETVRLRGSLDRLRRDWRSFDPPAELESAVTYARSMHRRPLEYYERRVEALGLAGRRVLDAGCGTGTWAFALRGRFEDVVGIDLNERRVEMARWLQRSAGVPSVSFSVGDVTATGFPSASFDAIFCYSVVISYLGLDPVFTEFRRLLCPGGQAYVCLNGPGWSYYLRDERGRTDERSAELGRQGIYNTLCSTTLAPAAHVLRSQPGLLSSLNGSPRPPFERVDEARAFLARLAEVLAADHGIPELERVWGQIAENGEAWETQLATDLASLPGGGRFAYSRAGRGYGPDEIGAALTRHGFADFRWAEEGRLGRDETLEPIFPGRFAGELNVWEFRAVRP